MKIRPRNIPKFQEGSKFNLGNWIINGILLFIQMLRFYKEVLLNKETIYGIKIN